MIGDQEQRMQAEGAATLGSPAGGSSHPGEAGIVEAVGRADYRGAIVLCVAHHGEAIGRLCMALLGSQADAEDATQETLVDAYRGLAGWRGEGTVRSWLLAIARRKCARQLERRTRQQAQLRLVTAEAPGADAAELAVVRQRAERARALLDGLRPSEREALVMRYGAGLSFAELARAFEIDEAAARKRVSRGISALRQRLGEEGQER